MGRFKDATKSGDMETHTIGGSNFQFSAAKIETLGSAQQTLTTIVVDGSGSVGGFWEDIKAVIREVVRACRQSPRADSMMLRVVVFSDDVEEVHGLVPLQDCNDDDYDSMDMPGSLTALYDASYSAIKATTKYGRALTQKQYDVNGAVFIITDGGDNRSKTTPTMVKEALAEARTSEAMESIMPVLIGVNTDASSGLNSYLETFKNEAEFQQYVTIGEATPESLAKLGGFISRSISSQSQALGTGGPSKSLSFS